MEIYMSLPSIDGSYLQNILVNLLKTPSPTGFTQRVMAQIEAALDDLHVAQLTRAQTRKGALVATWSGVSSDAPRALTAHVDTLGAMVKEVKSNGRLQLTPIGGFAWNTVEGEGCTVYLQQREPLRGALLVTTASGHVHGLKVGETVRDAEHMEVRLDARTSSAGETQTLGVNVGDFIAFDPRLEINNGFVRSRHLDDKASVACVLAAIKALNEAGLQPAQTTTFHFSNFEEVGHGAASGFPPDLAELVTVDMAVVGQGQSSDEFHATLCVKDSRGPYHPELSNRLRKLADEHQIAYKVDVYPFYGSDGEAYWRAGGDVAVALLGPGVDASHNYERTHQEALLATTQWLTAYLLAD
jgi:putative aminopeptidase FrvX